MYIKRANEILQHLMVPAWHATNLSLISGIAYGSLSTHQEQALSTTSMTQTKAKSFLSYWYN